MRKSNYALSYSLHGRSDLGALVAVNKSVKIIISNIKIAVKDYGI
jgi:hypothetical protein